MCLSPYQSGTATRGTGDSMVRTMNREATPRRKEEGGRRNLSRHSAFRIPRSALTLTEVLIAMGILTLGLLGVAALFPVASFYMQKAEIADNGSAIARTAMADVVARGMLDPDNWLVYNADGVAPISRGGATARIDTATASSFLRPIGLTVRAHLALLNNTTLPVADKQWCLNTELGSAYVLDPMGVAGATLFAANAANGLVYCFPAGSAMVPVQYYYDDARTAWRPWAGANSYAPTWPIRRVTFGQSNRAYTSQNPGVTQLRSAYAGELFSSQDDLALDLPDRDDLPARQNWDLVDNDNDTSTPPIPLARQWRGDYSWIVTVSPPSSAARDALADGGRGHEYNVSVVVFYKRPIGRGDPVSALQIRDAATLLQQQERTVRAAVVSTGLNGGELLLERQNDTLTGSPFDGLKVGEWLMLCGPHPASTDADPRFTLQWYRVVAIDGKDQPLDATGNQPNPSSSWDGVERRLVSLRGPEWPWQPAAGGLADNTALSNWLCVGIFPGAVAVHTRTMQLESSSPWSVD